MPSGPTLLGSTPNVQAIRNLQLVAPKFGLAIAQGLQDAWWAGFDPIVYESLRTDERQAWLYAQGRTRPGAIVTNAPTADHSYHRWGLAVDIISRKAEWDDPNFFDKIQGFFAKYNVDWAGDWHDADLPHFQWGNCPPKVPDFLIELGHAHGMQAVWQNRGAA
jgi:peptidoglycan L-alanyl-D-glutamate endopeptidase CwlK